MEESQQTGASVRKDAMQREGHPMQQGSSHEATGMNDAVGAVRATSAGSANTVSQSSTLVQQQHFQQRMLRLSFSGGGSYIASVRRASAIALPGGASEAHPLPPMPPSNSPPVSVMGVSEQAPSAAVQLQEVPQLLPTGEDFVHEILAMNTLAMEQCYASLAASAAVRGMTAAATPTASGGGVAPGVVMVNTAANANVVSEEPMKILSEAYMRLDEASAQELPAPLLSQLKATTLNNMGVVECNRGQTRQALSHFEAARQLEENNAMTSPSVALNTCAAYNALRMYDKATAAALEAIDMLRSLEVQRERNLRLAAATATSTFDLSNALRSAKEGTGQGEETDAAALALEAASAPKIADSQNEALWGAAWNNLAIAQINTARGSKDLSEYTNTLTLFQNAMRATQDLLGPQHPMSKAVVKTFRTVRRAFLVHGAFKQHRTLLHAPLPTLDPREQEWEDAQVEPLPGHTRHGTLQQQRQKLTITFRGEVTGGQKIIERLDGTPYPGAAEQPYQTQRRGGGTTKTISSRSSSTKRKRKGHLMGTGTAQLLRGMPLSATLSRASIVYGNPHPLMYSPPPTRQELDWIAAESPLPSASHGWQGGGSTRTATNQYNAGLATATDTMRGRQGESPESRSIGRPLPQPPRKKMGGGRNRAGGPGVDSDMMLYPTAPSPPQSQRSARADASRGTAVMMSAPSPKSGTGLPPINASDGAGYYPATAQVSTTRGLEATATQGERRASMQRKTSRRAAPPPRKGPPSSPSSGDGGAAGAAAAMMQMHQSKMLLLATPSSSGPATAMTSKTTTYYPLEVDAGGAPPPPSPPENRGTAPSTTSASMPYVTPTTTSPKDAVSLPSPLDGTESHELFRGMWVTADPHYVHRGPRIFDRPAYYTITTALDVTEDGIQGSYGVGGSGTQGEPAAGNTFPTLTYTSSSSSNSSDDDGEEGDEGCGVNLHGMSTAPNCTSSSTAARSSVSSLPNALAETSRNTLELGTFTPLQEERGSLKRMRHSPLAKPAAFSSRALPRWSSASDMHNSSDSDANDGYTSPLEKSGPPRPSSSTSTSCSSTPSSVASRSSAAAAARPSSSSATTSPPQAMTSSSPSVPPVTTAATPASTFASTAPSTEGGSVAPSSAISAASAAVAPVATDTDEFLKANQSNVRKEDGPSLPTATSVIHGVTVDNADSIEGPQRPPPMRTLTLSPLHLDQGAAAAAAHASGLAPMALCSTTQRSLEGPSPSSPYHFSEEELLLRDTWVVDVDTAVPTSEAGNGERPEDEAEVEVVDTIQTVPIAVPPSPEEARRCREKGGVPYPSHLTFRIVPRPASSTHPGSSDEVEERAQKTSFASCGGFFQRRRERAQRKAEQRAAVRLQANRDALHSHHVPLVRFRTTRQELPATMLSGNGANQRNTLPTVEEAAGYRRSGVAHLGTKAHTREPFKAGAGQQLSSKTSYAFGRRAGGGPGGVGQSAFAREGDPQFFWMVQLEEGPQVRLERIVAE